MNELCVRARVQQDEFCIAENGNIHHSAAERTTDANTEILFYSVI